MLISIWFLKDTKTTRTNLRIASYLIIGALVTIIIWNILWVAAFCDTKDVMVGTGDSSNEDNYEKQSKGTYIAGYIIIGIILLTIAIFFVILVEKYKT